MANEIFVDRMFGKSSKKNMRVRCAMLNFSPERVIHRCIPNGKKQYRRIANNNVKHATRFQSVYKSETKKEAHVAY